MNDPFEHMTSDDFMEALKPENWTETTSLHTHSYEFERTSNGVQIRDGRGEVHLTPEGALTLLQWLDAQKGKLTRAVNGPDRERDTGEQESL
ncbi:MAG TPA: hypothetical protein VEL31_09790 [Ktedonobacteraceae bacterium]|nr:hypothetical protein [Ktedonobacteraceae bacterium]